MATGETWPNLTVPYSYPRKSDANGQKWQAAIDDALGSGSLQLTARDCDDDDFYELVGNCPRCGHEMAQDVEFDVIFGALPGRTVTLDVNCNCAEDTHAGRPSSYRGCGWGGTNAVRLTKS
jgi:hypothetical protein